MNNKDYLVGRFASIPPPFTESTLVPKILTDWVTKLNTKLNSWVTYPNWAPIGGTPLPPPFTDFFNGEKFTDWGGGGTPQHPFTDGFRKKVFHTLPN